jgi:hypothetical protein
MPSISSRMPTVAERKFYNVETVTLQYCIIMYTDNRHC